mmetsp:Transcript_17121/g.53135  ORF Transcript_17121/g.53135 Transcript_17121/m.53135 type:complete len:412 (-) Transcript_17121:904-2139(-)
MNARVGARAARGGRTEMRNRRSDKPEHSCSQCPSLPLDRDVAAGAVCRTPYSEWGRIGRGRCPYPRGERSYLIETGDVLHEPDDQQRHGVQRDDDGRGPSLVRRAANEDEGQHRHLDENNRRDLRREHPLEVLARHEEEEDREAERVVHRGRADEGRQRDRHGLLRLLAGVRVGGDELRPVGDQRGEDEGDVERRDVGHRAKLRQHADHRVREEDDDDGAEAHQHERALQNALLLLLGRKVRQVLGHLLFFFVFVVVGSGDSVIVLGARDLRVGVVDGLARRDSGRERERVVVAGGDGGEDALHCDDELIKVDRAAVVGVDLREDGVDFLHRRLLAEGFEQELELALLDAAALVVIELLEVGLQEAAELRVGELRARHRGRVFLQLHVLTRRRRRLEVVDDGRLVLREDAL